jgi:CheY-like chemotaxis protein
MNRKYTIIFILIWLIVSIIIALFFFLPFIFFAIAVLLILLAYDFYQKGRPLADKTPPKKTKHIPAIPSAPVPDIRTVQTKGSKAPPVPEGVNQAAIDLKNKGNEFFRQNKFEEAIRCYASAVDIDSGYSDAWNNLGMAFLKAGKVDLANSCNEKVRELNSKRPPKPAQEPVAHPPVIAETPVPEEQKELQKEGVQETEPDTISFLRNVAQPAGYVKKEPEYMESPGPAPGITREFTEIPTITSDKEPDWKSLFKSVSEMEASGESFSATAPKDLKLKGTRDEIPIFDRVIPPLENEEEPAAYPARDIITEPEIVPPAIQEKIELPVPEKENIIPGPVPEEIKIVQEEIELPVPEKEDIIPGPVPEEIKIVQEEIELPVPEKEDIIPGPVPEEIKIAQEEIELPVPEKEDIIPGPVPEEIKIAQEEIKLPVPEKEDIIPGPVPEEIKIVREEIPGHITIQAATETIPPAYKKEEPFTFDIDAEIPGFALLPPDLEEFPEDIPDTPVVSGEEKTRPVKKEIISDIKGGIPASGVDERMAIEEILGPQQGSSKPDLEEKPAAPDELLKQEFITASETAVPVRKAKAPSTISAETVIRKPKAERFPQEMPGGFEPYEQMVGHESLLVSEKAARDILQTPVHVPEKLILIIDDNDYIVTGLEHMLRKNGYITASCNTGKDALEILGNKNIDAVLLDLNMEPMNGWQLLGIMRSDIRTKDIPVIIFSAKETLQEEASRTPLKISAFLSKPVNTRLLLSELEKIFKGEGSSG